MSEGQVAERHLVRTVVWGVVLAALVGGNIYQYVLWASAPTTDTRRNIADAATRVDSGVDRLHESVDRLDELHRSLAGFADQRVIERFHELFYSQLSSSYGRWLGVETLQNPNDVWVTQEIICEQRPDLVVETGTANGGSSLIWAMILEQVNPKGKVVTIDIERHSDKAQSWPIAQRRVEYLIGSSTDSKLVAEVSRKAAGKRTLVILDSDHSKAHVLDELRAYAGLVPVGGYLIVQDTNINGHPVLSSFGPGPMEAVDEFLATDNRFEPDRSREKFLFSMHPKGYLKRIR